MKKSFISKLMLVCFLMTMSFNVSYATKNTSEQAGEKIETTEPITVAEEKAESFNVSDIPDATPQLKQKEVVVKDKNITKTPSIINTNQRASEFSFSGTIANQGQFAWVYPITLGYGQIIQARMESPSNSNLDYDLYLYEFDSAAGDIVGNALAVSAYKTYLNTYPDGTKKTLDESLGHVNVSGGTKSYAIGVYSRTGGSSTDKFNLYISLDAPTFNSDGSAFWPYEINESQNAANTFGSINTNSSVSGFKINSLNDNDWFELRTPNDFTLYAEYLNIDLLENQTGSTTPNAQCTSELYYTKDGESMILIPKTSNGKYLVESNGLGDSGIYYLRIIPNSNFSGYAEYQFKTGHEKLPATQILVTGFNSIGGPNNFIKLFLYGEGYLLPYNGDWITIKGCVANKKGVVVATTSSYGNVNAEWSSGGWAHLPDDDEIFGNIPASASVGKDGRFEVTIKKIPAAQGVIRNNGTVYTSLYDIDTVRLWMNGSINSATTNFFHGAGTR